MDRARVLVVDDDRALAEGIADVLDASGYEVEIANDGFQAIELAQRAPPDILLTDIRMPGMDGVEAYKRIKEFQPRIRAIMMTAYSVEELISRALVEGAYEVLSKPLDIGKLLALLGTAASGLSALVVDDDSALCETIKDVLEERGYRVCTAGDCPEATELAQREPLDVLIIDIKLPTRDGLETYLALHEMNPNAAAIMMTGYREETDDLVVRAMKSGAYTCLYKPLDMEVVERKIAEALRAKRGLPG